MSSLYSLYGANNNNTQSANVSAKQIYRADPPVRTVAFAFVPRDFIRREIKSKSSSSVLFHLHQYNNTPHPAFMSLVSRATGSKSVFFILKHTYLHSKPPFCGLQFTLCVGLTAFLVEWHSLIRVVSCLRFSFSRFIDNFYDTLWAYCNLDVCIF